MANPYLSMDAVQLVGRIRQNCKQIEDLSNLTNMLAEAVQVRFSLDNTVNIPGIKPEVRELLRSILSAPDASTFAGAFERSTPSQQLSLEEAVGLNPRGRPRKSVGKPGIKRVAAKRVMNRLESEFLPAAPQPQQTPLMAAPLNATEPVVVAEEAPTRLEQAPETARVYGPTQHSNSPLYRMPPNNKTPPGFHARAMIQFAKEHGNVLDTGNFRQALKGKPGFTSFLETTIYTLLGRLTEQGNFRLISKKPRMYELQNDDVSYITGPTPAS